MKLSNFGKTLAGTIFSFSILLGVGLATNVTTQAQYQNDQYRRDRDRDQRQRDRDYDSRNNRRGRNRNDDNYGNYGGSSQLRQTALNAGYNEGAKAGRDDRNRRRNFEYRDENSFQKATKDYSSRLGDRGIYQTYFRQAFVNGYSDGFRGY
jgi:hypothetical protein